MTTEELFYQKLDEFIIAGGALLDVWMDISNETDHIVCKNFPETRSFDDVLADYTEWRDSLKDKLIPKQP